MMSRPLPRLVSSWVRPTPHRLTGILILISTVSSLISFGMSYLIIRNDLDTVLGGQLRQTMASNQAMTDTDDLHERLAADTGSLDPAGGIVVMAPLTGPAIGNVARFPPIAGQTIVRQIATTADASARAIAES